MPTSSQTTSLKEVGPLKNEIEDSSSSQEVGTPVDEALEKTALAVGQDAVNQQVMGDDDSIEYPSGPKLFLLA